MAAHLPGSDGARRRQSLDCDVGSAPLSGRGAGNSTARNPAEAVSAVADRSGKPADYSLVGEGDEVSGI